jgi:crossover junction endodeoxyribonuclease RusA
MVRSAEANAYRRHVADVAEGLCCEPIEGPVRLKVILHPKLTISGAASAVVLDLDNCLKVAQDALQGIAYANDKQVRSIRADYGDPVDGGGVTVRVTKII